MSARATRAVAPLALMLPGVALVAVLFAWPLLRLIIGSVTDPEPNLDSYRALFHDPTLWLIIRTTLIVAAECTIVTLLIAYPLGFLLSQLERRLANRLLMLVLLPFWTSLLVRMYAWMVLLGRHGVINEALTDAGILGQPLPLLYNRFAVLVGMSHYMLPFMVLSLYSVMLGIDRSLLEAAGTMGSSVWQTFWRVYLPLSLPGVYAGSLLVFILSLGFYITPALLGSPQDTTIAVYIQQQIELLNWADGTAMAVVLVAIIGVLFAVYDRLLGFNRLFAMGPGLMRLLRALLWVHGIAAFVFLILPLLIVVPVSFSSSPYLQFPPPGWSLRWYGAYFGDPQWIDATVLSLEVAVATVLLSVTLGSAASVALVRLPLPGMGILRAVLMMPLVVPSIVLAIAIYSIYVRLHLIGSFLGIVLAHTVLALPFTVVLMTGGLQRVDRRLEEASYTMGASAWRTFRLVTLPIVRPSLFAAAVFAFITSWDEVILVMFIGGSSGVTLPLRMFSFLRTEINPSISAVSTLLLLLAAAAFAVSEWLKKPIKS